MPNSAITIIAEAGVNHNGFLEKVYIMENIFKPFLGILHLSVYTSGSPSGSLSGSNCSDFDFDFDPDPDSKSVNYFPSKMKDAHFCISF